MGLTTTSPAICAAANFTIQWASNGYDSRKVNWFDVGASFCHGAAVVGLSEVTGGFGIGGLTAGMGEGAGQEIFRTALSYGAGNLAYGVVSGEHMSLDNSLKLFGQGFLIGAAVGSISQAIKGIVRGSAGVSAVQPKNSLAK